LPEARSLTIWSDKGAVCAVFVGQCSTGFSKKDLAPRPFDYFVISSGRTNRSLKLSGSVNDMVDFRVIYTTDTIAKTILLDSRPSNTVRIVPGSVLK
jgi:hypothetical protein